MKDFHQLNELVINWASEKGILDKATPLAHISKTMEEVHETMLAIAAQANGLDEFINFKGETCNTADEILDGFGDILVTVLIGLKMQGLDALVCLQSAYDVISKRTGTLS